MKKEWLWMNPNLPEPVDVDELNKPRKKKDTPNVFNRGPERGSLERWLDKHNHKMELLRTLTSAIAAVASMVVLLIVW